MTEPAARLPFDPSCLAQAAAGQIMLRRRGSPGTVVVGSTTPTDSGKQPTRSQSDPLGCPRVAPGLRRRVDRRSSSEGFGYNCLPDASQWQEGAWCGSEEGRGRGVELARCAQVGVARGVVTRGARRTPQPVTLRLRHWLNFSRSSSPTRDCRGVTALPKLASLALRHRVTGELQAYARRINDTALQRPFSTWKAPRRKLLGNALAVANVTRVLDEAGVPHAYIKGLGLAALTRSNPQDRSTNNIDVLVVARRLRPAADALIAAGAVRAPHYPPIDSYPPSRAFQSLRAEATLFFADQAIDLHWHAGPDPAVYPPPDAAIRRAVDVAVFGVPFRTLSPADALWHGALHFRDDGFRRAAMRWMC